MGNIKWFIPRKYFAISKPLSNREFSEAEAMVREP